MKRILGRYVDVFVTHDQPGGPDVKNSLQLRTPALLLDDCKLCFV